MFNSKSFGNQLLALPSLGINVLALKICLGAIYKLYVKDKISNSSHCFRVNLYRFFWFRGLYEKTTISIRSPLSFSTLKICLGKRGSHLVDRNVGLGVGGSFRGLMLSFIGCFNQVFDMISYEVQRRNGIGTRLS